MILTVDESLSKLNIPKARYKVAASVAEADRVARSFGFPVVLKLISKKVVHKTEAKGVVIAESASEVKDTAQRFLKKGTVLVQEHVSGVELFLGIKNDATFGHVLLAGVGGIFVEVYKDVSFRVCPITKKDAEQMLDELKGSAILKGVRGQKPIDKKKLVDAMVTLSKLPERIENLDELDVNPIFASSRSVKAVDARMVLKD